MKALQFVVAVMLVISTAAGPAMAQTAPQAKKTTAAILDLEAKGVSASETASLSDRLRSEMFRTGAFDMMERGKMQELLKEQGFQQSGACNTNACAIEVGQLIGVEKMIAGSLGKVGKTYSVDLRMIDVRTGRMEQSVTEDYTGEIDKLLTVVMRSIAQKMAAAVNTGLAPGALPKPAGEKKAIYKKWWFWGGVGALAAGGAAAALLGGSGTTTDETPTDTSLPIPPNPPLAPGVFGEGGMR